MSVVDNDREERRDARNFDLYLFCEPVDPKPTPLDYE